MFICNLKLNKKAIKKIFIAICIIVLFSIISYSIYTIFFKNNSSVENGNSIIEINESNYANILKDANENIDDYIGYKVKITGYIYRLLDFDKNQFVIARDMKIDKINQTLVIGFLCEYSKASNFPDGTWVEIVGEIVKGNFNGDIAMLKIISIKETTPLQNPLVSMPNVAKVVKHPRPLWQPLLQLHHFFQI